MKAHIHPIAWEVRLYEDTGKPAEQCYADQDDWDGAMLIRRIGNKAHISMAQKGFDRKVVKQIRDFLLTQGIHTAEWDGNGMEQIMRLTK